MTLSTEHPWAGSYLKSSEGGAQRRTQTAADAGVRRCFACKRDCAGATLEECQGWRGSDRVGTVHERSDDGLARLRALVVARSLSGSRVA